MPADIIIGLRDTARKYSQENITYILLNDMDYSGNQIGKTLHPFMLKRYTKIMKEPSKNRIIRASVFSSEYSFIKLNKYKEETTIDKKCGGINIVPICIEIIPTFFKKLQNIYGSKADEIYSYCIAFFGECASDGQGSMTNIYFDHKVADYASSIALSYSLGIIPNKKSYTIDSSSPRGESCNKKYNKDFKDKIVSQEIYSELRNDEISVINNCDHNLVSEKYKKLNENYDNMILEMDDDQITRCPFAWYKKVDYERGEIDLSETRMDISRLRKKSLQSGKSKRSN